MKILRDHGRNAGAADIARFVRRPYGTVLLHRPAGIMPAADLGQEMRNAGEIAARQAVQAGACAVDLSSLHFDMMRPCL